jgi:Ca2+-transporting ATPase
MIITNDLLLFFLLYLQPDGNVHIHWKGAAEIVLESCTQYIDATDKFVAMDEDKV